MRPGRSPAGRGGGPFDSPVARRRARATPNVPEGDDHWLDDRIEGLAARATPPGGQSRVPRDTPSRPGGYPRTGTYGGPIPREPAPVAATAPRNRPAAQPPTAAQPAVMDPGPPPIGEPTSPGGFRYGDHAELDPYDDDMVMGELDDDELPPERRRGCARRLGLLALAVAAVMCLLLVAGGVWVRGKISPGGPPGEVVTVEVSRGQSTSDIGTTLEDAGVITDATVWTWYVRFRGGGDIQAGSYEMRENLSMGDALDILTAGPASSEPDRVTIPEGFSVRQTVARLSDPEDGVPGFTAEALNAALQDPSVRSRYLPQDQTSLEGTLFPHTYDIEEGLDERALLQQMVQRFESTAQEVDLDGGTARLNEALGLTLTAYDVVKVASMIEEEARVEDERGQIARVIYNRLQQDMALGIDATSCYESGECPPTAAELESDSPYNTRRRRGLPPTPISSPSAASLEAALNPTEGPWLYYVLADEEGNHRFTDDREQFDQWVEECRDAGLC